MASSIHPTAIVQPGATLGDDVHIGPYCVVGPEVRLGDRVVLDSHVVVTGRTTIGAGTRVFAFACLGNPPQDQKYRGEPSRLTIGRGNTIREYVTMNTGTAGGRLETRVGDHGLFMVGVHIAHDCVVGDHVVMANNATLAGHVELGDHAGIGGLSAVHQFVRIGEHAFVGGMTGVEQDVVPYALVKGDRGYVAGLNVVGLKRRGFGRDEIELLRSSYRTLFHGQGEFARRIDDIDAAFGRAAAVQRLVRFLRADSSRRILRPRFEDAA